MHDRPKQTATSAIRRQDGIRTAPFTVLNETIALIFLWQNVEKTAVAATGSNKRLRENEAPQSGWF